MKSQLTIIIPFLNEKEEVINTVESIRKHSDSEEIVILLINDASDDGFDYERIAKKYDTEYLLNSKRIGVAASRDLGVAQSNTPYIMLLDAHMRFYDDRWVHRILDELKKDPKVLLCCQTKGLKITNGKVVEIKERPLSYGACINLYTGRLLFECQWIFDKCQDNSNLQTVQIPCILGATYCCSKDYWLYLKGLEGLMYYGNDESYISIKVYLEGGTCKLLKDIVVGHIYRDSPPYKLEDAPRLYNRFLLSELLLPNHYRSRFLSQIIHYYFNYNYQDALFLLYQNRKNIYKIKEYYSSIFRHQFSYFEKLNNKSNTFKNITKDKEGLLKDIGYYVISNSNLSSDIGLLSGKLGIVIFLYHYSHYSEDETYCLFADRILDHILNSIYTDLPTEFYSGLIGIGWGIEYLHQNGFIEGDTSDILENIDKKVIEITPTIKDVSLDKGLGGIVHYVLSRLYTIGKERKNNPFNSIYLSDLYKVVKSILDAKNRNSDSLSIFIRYLVFFENISPIPPPSIYDIIYLSIPQEYQPEKYVPGLDGNAGTGLKLIFENFKSTI